MFRNVAGPAKPYSSGNAACFKGVDAEIAVALHRSRTGRYRIDLHRLEPFDIAGLGHFGELREFRPEAFVRLRAEVRRLRQFALARRGLTAARFSLRERVATTSGLAAALRLVSLANLAFAVLARLGAASVALTRNVKPSLVLIISTSSGLWPAAFAARCAAIEIAQLQAKQQLVQRGIDLSSQEAQAIIANAGAIERLNQSLALARASTQALMGLTDTVFNRFADLIAQGKADWKSRADAGRAAILDINKELLKLALLNPLKNLLFGTNLPTMSSVGGIIGSLLKGLKFLEGGVAGVDGQPILLPAAVFRHAPRFHDGAFLSPDEIPAILQRGERVLSRREAQSYNARGSGASPVVNVTIQTPNPSAFQASRTQLAADLSRAVQIGMRRR